MNSASGTSLRTLLIGIDGASFNVLNPLFESDDIPALESLFTDRASDRLKSQIPPWTASAWPSIYTGVNPGKHGVFGFLAFEGYDWAVVNATHVDARPIWQILDTVDKRSVIVNVPVTHPPRPFDGALVPGYAAPEDPTCHPEGLLEDIRDAIGEYRVYAETEGASRVDREAHLAEYRSLLEMRGRAFRYLLDEYDPEFGFLQFQQTDTVCHDLPDDREAYREVYQTVDQQVAKTIAEHNPETVIVVSDHGIGPYDGRVSGNEYLRDRGYVEGTTDGEGMPTWARLRDSDLRETSTGVGTEALNRIASILTAFGVSGQRVESLLETIGIAESVRTHMPAGAIRASSEQVDFADSQAYFRSRIECGVRLNVERREPDGVIPEGAYEDTRDELISLLSSLSDDDGEPIFEEVCRSERYFEGPHVDDGPDIVTIPRGFDIHLTTWLTGNRFEQVSGQDWDHQRHGVVALSGADVDESGVLDGAHLFDIAPTVLATLGVPADEEMDGATLPVVESVGQRSYSPYESRTSTSTESETVKSRLEDLGYIE